MFRWRVRRGTTRLRRLANGDGAGWRNRRAVVSAPAADEHAIGSGAGEESGELEAAAASGSPCAALGKAGEWSGTEAVGWGAWRGTRAAGVSCSCAARGQGGEEESTRRWTIWPPGPAELGVGRGALGHRGSDYWLVQDPKEYGCKLIWRSCV